MKLLIHTNCSAPRVVEATRVVVLDAFDNPIAFALEVDDRTILTETLSEKNSVTFHSMLHNLGIMKTVLVTEAAQKTMTTGKLTDC